MRQVIQDFSFRCQEITLPWFLAMKGMRGAQAGNCNAVKHGGYLHRFDGRTVLGRAQRQVEASLMAALGKPSPQELLLLGRAAIKAIRCKILEHEILNGNRTPTLEKHYLRWARELREDLKALGLKRQQEPVPNLQDYLKENYAES